MSLQDISPQQAKQMCDSGGAVLIDVREPAEHSSKHIPNSKLLPLGRISASDIEDSQQNLVIYCQKGMRGKKACEKLIKDNPKLKVFNIVGGIENWEQCGFDTQRGQSTVMPLDRQVQLSIGVLLLLFSALTMGVSFNFIWAVVVIGSGLVVAGSTGFCGLGRVIAMMPWNQRA
ncbi:rhodanese-like domain-containing protein [Glaciecola siphonariae]|uniref:Rhodanese-like domain-containing protein n=1 Tax=Glaciecola siphonariae TaxID=521012 RepID=A0ABV9M0L8_9ALTE